MTTNREHAGKSIGEPLIVNDEGKGSYGVNQIEIPCSDVQFMVEDAVLNISMLVERLICDRLDIPAPRNVRDLRQLVSEGISSAGQLVELGFHLAERAVLALEYGKELVAQHGEHEVQTDHDL